MKALLASAAADKLFPAINVHDELFLGWLMYQLIQKAFLAHNLEQEAYP